MRSHGYQGGRETKEKPGYLHKLSPRTPARPPGLSSQGPLVLMEQLQPVPPGFASKLPAGPSWGAAWSFCPEALGGHLSPPESSACLGPACPSGF